MYTKQKLKIWEDEIKLTAQQNNQALKKCLQRKTVDNEIEFKRRRAITKEKSEKHITNPWKNLYHTQHLPYTK